MDNPKDCPFCNCNIIRSVEYIHPGANEYTMRCDECKAEGPVSYIDELHAQYLWDKRG